MPATSKKSTPTKHNLVQFRLSPGLIEQLEATGMKSGEERNECAKRLVTEALSLAWLERLQQRLDESDGRVEMLREDLATTVALLLVQFAKEDPDRVQKWVREHLLKRTS